MVDLRLLTGDKQEKSKQGDNSKSGVMSRKWWNLEKQQRLYFKRFLTKAFNDVTRYNKIK